MSNDTICTGTTDARALLSAGRPLAVFVGAWVVLAGAGAGAGAAASASAQEPLMPVEGTEGYDVMPVPEPTVPDVPYPVRHAWRPLNLPQRHLRVGGTLGVYRFDDASRALTGNDSTLSLTLGASAAVTDWLEVGIAGERLALRHFVISGTAVPQGLVALALTPDPEFGDIPVYARFAVVRDPSLYVSADVGLVIPTDSDVTAFIAAAIRGRVTDALTFDSGAEITLRFEDGSRDAHLDIWIPFSALIQVHDQVFFAARSGVRWLDFDDLQFPLGFELGYTIASDARPLMDLMLGFGFPELFRPNAVGDRAGEDIWQVTLTGQVFFAL